MSLILFTLVALLSLVRAAVVPFTVQGALSSATADSAEYNTGGKIVVNGLEIIIPENLQFQFPAAFVPFKNIATGRFDGMEVAVVGNYVDEVAIAGLVQISQFLLNTNDGTIASLGFDGKITLTSGQVLRINDPNAVYSAGYTNMPEFTADDENPSISAFSGFPMCVPRSATDPKCPQSNRPAGSRTFTAPDPTIMAPFQQGDYITYSGVLIDGEFICYSIVAQNVQILTTGVAPYIRVEEAIIGLVSPQNAGVEFADSRFVGYTTDASVAVTVSRIDINPCNGEETDVAVGSAAIRAGDARNRWIWRAEGETPGVKYSRDYRVTTTGGQQDTNGGQIRAGQYVQPVTEFIFPEADVPGVIPPPNDFSQMVNLRDGIGPDEDGNVWGQLKPWPQGSPAPTPFTTDCPPENEEPTTPPTGPPVVNAGADQTLRAGVVAVLSGTVSNSQEFPSNDLSYSWAQKTGSPLTITGGNTAKCSFTLPNVTAITEYELTLTVESASNGLSSNDTIKVLNDPATADIIVIDSYTWTSRQSGTISVNAHSNVVDGAARLQLILNTGAANPAPINMVNAGAGRFTYNARSTNQPTGGITVQSNLGGRATTTTLSQKRRR
jgi:hypothetical protein